MARQGQGPGSRAYPGGGASGGGTPAKSGAGAGGNKDRGCCPMVAAGRAARRGKFRLAARYAAWSVRLIAARIV